MVTNTNFIKIENTKQNRFSNNSHGTEDQPQA